jgi:hypothetical protein
MAWFETRFKVSKEMATRFVICSLMVLIGQHNVAAAPSGTAFSYQGQLKQAGAPANGLYDFEFRLFDLGAGGAQQGPMVPKSDVPVENGLMTMNLDFGSVFDGNRRWLEVRVRDGASTGAFTPLVPKQELTAAPYALYALGGPGGSGPWQTSAADIFNTNSGNVGIGPGTPHHRLRVSGGPVWTSNGWIGSLELDNVSAIGWQPNLAGNRFGIGQSNGGLFVFHSASDPGTTGSSANYDLVISDAGKVGIGNPSPQMTLDIVSPQHVLAMTAFGPDITFYDTGNGFARSVIQSVGGDLNFFTESYMSGANPTSLLKLSNVGNVGAGTPTPVRRLHTIDPSIFSARFETSHPTAAVAEFRSSSSNNTWEVGVAGSAPPFGLGAGDMYLYRQGNGAPGLSISIANHVATMPCADFRIGHESRRGSPGRALVDNGDHLVVNFGTDWGYTFVHGRLKTGILEVLGADVAEKFPSSDDMVEPGTVMEIDPDQPGKLRIAREPYSSRVAGVVSGAGNLSAGAVLGNSADTENAPAIALSGRVWVQCDATGAAIAAGDLLTTSQTPGFAMKASDRERSHGAVLGKAMTTLAKGERGLVLVLVNLQ